MYVKGIHEPLITESLFNEVQDILTGRKKSVPVKNTRHEALPLRGYLTCVRCGRPLTGSTSHGNGGKYYYYHCQPSLGCKERFKAVEANTAFVGYLKMFQAKEEVLNLYFLIMEERFKKAKTTKSTVSKDRQAKLEKLNTRLKNAKEMMLDGEMERSEYKQIKAEIELEIERLTNAQTATNGLEDDYRLYVRKRISILKDLATIYASADLQRKQQIQGAIFPEKLVYSEKNYRTKTLHPIFEVITTTEEAFRENKNRKDQQFSNLSCQVAPRVETSNLLLQDLRDLCPFLGISG